MDLIVTRWFLFHDDDDDVNLLGKSMSITKQNTGRGYYEKQQ
jgi:hypothetical protein